MQEILNIVPETNIVLYKDKLQSYCKQYPKSEWLIQYFPDERLLFHRMLMNEDEEPIGFMIYGFELPGTSFVDSTSDLIILAVHIDEMYRNRGYLNKALDELKEYGLPIFLYVPDVSLVQTSSLFSRVGICL